MGKRKRAGKRTPEERRRSEETRKELEERLEYWNTRMIEKYGPDYETPRTYEEWLEHREKYGRIDRERELEARPLRRLGRWLRSKAA